ncbi:hypothetical protein C8R43DRAFT_985117 [Mycena crocata]|nr:hypothetical protein C8R43DRAFT_985117 [Mycena crocata]
MGRELSFNVLSIALALATALHRHPRVVHFVILLVQAPDARMRRLAMLRGQSSNIVAMFNKASLLSCRHFRYLRCGVVWSGACCLWHHQPSAQEEFAHE